MRMGKRSEKHQIFAAPERRSRIPAAREPPEKKPPGRMTGPASVDPSSPGTVEPSQDPDEEGLPDQLAHGV
jgi:hypothetical protein